MRLFGSGRLLAGFLWVTAASAAPAPPDAVRNDPPSAWVPPAGMYELHVTSGDARINGLLYTAAGAGPHPIVVFLHGFPGNERNLDLAQAVRRAGYQALFFDYRGIFGSGGTFSHAGSLEDVARMLAWVRAPENASRYAIDASRMAVVGHSFGGWLALLAVEHEPVNVCVAALAAWNAGWQASRFAEFPQERTEMLDYFKDTTDPLGGPVRADPAAMLDEVAAHAADWNYLRQADALKDRSLLLVAATRDTPDENVPMHAELAEAIRRAGGHSVKFRIFEDDHPFSSHRVALADMLVRWLRTDCAAAQSTAAR